MSPNTEANCGKTAHKELHESDAFQKFDGNCLKAMLANSDDITAKWKAWKRSNDGKAILTPPFSTGRLNDRHYAKSVHEAFLTFTLQGRHLGESEADYMPTYGTDELLNEPTADGNRTSAAEGEEGEEEGKGS